MNEVLPTAEQLYKMKAYGRTRSEIRLILREEKRFLQQLKYVRNTINSWTGRVDKKTILMVIGYLQRMKELIPYGNYDFNGDVSERFSFVLTGYIDFLINSMQQATWPGQQTFKFYDDQIKIQEELIDKLKAEREGEGTGSSEASNEAPIGALEEKPTGEGDGGQSRCGRS